MRRLRSDDFMRYALAPIAVLSAAALLFASITPAYACQCEFVPLEERVEGSEIVALGEVLSLTVTVVGDYDPPLTMSSGAVVSVERYLKGSGASTITVDESSPLTSCTYFSLRSLDQRHLLFLRADDGRLVTHSCSGNIRLTGAYIDENAANADLEEVEAILGFAQPAGVPPTGGAGVGGEGSYYPIALVALGLALQVGGAFAIVGSRPRR